jgi:hypothetical protein
MGSWITRTNRAKFSESREESCYPWGIREERRGIDSMTKAIRAGLGGAWIAAALCFATLSIAQQNIPAVAQNSRAYNVSREAVLEGTVLRYTPSASSKPLGAHVTLQTAAGPVDVHLGNAHLLSANHFSLAAGDSLRITGENVAYGNTTQFLARVVQKGAQSLTVRTNRGFPLSPGGKLGSSRSQVGAL